MDKNTEEFYIRLKEELSNTSEWPAEYLYKFIVPTDVKKIEEIENALLRGEESDYSSALKL